MRTIGLSLLHAAVALLAPALRTSSPRCVGPLRGISSATFETTPVRLAGTSEERLSGHMQSIRAETLRHAAPLAFPKPSSICRQETNHPPTDHGSCKGIPGAV